MEENGERERLLTTIFENTTEMLKIIDSVKNIKEKIDIINWIIDEVEITDDEMEILVKLRSVGINFVNEWEKFLK